MKSCGLDRCFRLTGKCALLAAAAAFVAACGGGGGGSSSPGTSATLVGVAAQGQGIANARITLMDRVGNVQTATAAADGTYAMTTDLARFVPPFAFEAQDPSGAADPQVSLLVGAPGAGTTQTVNITPLTTAVAAGAVSSGNPFDILKTAVLASLRAADVSDAQAALRTVLMNHLTDAGIANPAAVNFVSSAFVADHTGLDRVLDEIVVTFAGDGVQVTNSLNVGGNNQFVKLSRATVGSGAVAAVSFTRDLPLATFGPGVFAGIQSAWLACFSQPASQRVDGGTLGTACRSAVSASPAFLANGSDFLHAYSGWLTGDLIATQVLLPKVLYAESATKAMLRLTLLGSDGNAYVTNVAAQQIDGIWQITGNQSHYDLSVTANLSNGFVVPANTASWSAPSQYFNAGMYIFANPFVPGTASTNDIGYVAVTGPGLPPNGVVLGRNGACGVNYMPIDNKNGTPVASTSATGNSFVIDRVAALPDGTTSALPQWPDNRNTASQALADFDPLRGYPNYTFTIHRADGSTAVETRRLQMAPVPAATGTAFVWDVLGSDTLSLLTANQPAAAALALAWSSPAGASPVQDVKVTSSDGATLVQGVAALNGAATAATVTAPSGGNCAAGSSVFPGLANAGAARSIQIDYRTRNSVPRDSIYVYD